MQNFVFLAVLFAALCHAGWNALIKTGLDPLRATTVIALGAVAVALPLLLISGLPDAAAWPWLVASMAVQSAANLRTRRRRERSEICVAE